MSPGQVDLPTPLLDAVESLLTLSPRTSLADFVDNGVRAHLVAARLHLYGVNDGGIDTVFKGSLHDWRGFAHLADDLIDKWDQSLQFIAGDLEEHIAVHCKLKMQCLGVSTSGEGFTARLRFLDDVWADGGKAAMARLLAAFPLDLGFHTHGQSSGPAPDQGFDVVIERHEELPPAGSCILGSPAHRKLMEAGFPNE